MILNETKGGPVTHEGIKGKGLGESVGCDFCRGNVSKRDGLCYEFSVSFPFFSLYSVSATETKV